MRTPESLPKIEQTNANYEKYSFNTCVAIFQKRHLKAEIYDCQENSVELLPLQISKNIFDTMKLYETQSNLNVT